MITSFYGFDNLKVYGNFGETTGVVSFNFNEENIGYLVDNDKGYYYDYFIYGCDGNQFLKSIEFSFTQPGILESEDFGWGVIYDIYQIPAGGISEITEDDYIGYDYNFFYIDATRKSNGTNSISPLRLKAPKSHFNKGEQIAFEHKCRK